MESITKGGGAEGAAPLCYGGGRRPPPLSDVFLCRFMYFYVCLCACYVFLLYMLIYLLIYFIYLLIYHCLLTILIMSIDFQRFHRNKKDTDRNSEPDGGRIAPRCLMFDPFTKERV